MAGTGSANGGPNMRAKFVKAAGMLGRALLRQAAAAVAVSHRVAVHRFLRPVGVRLASVAVDAVLCDVQAQLQRIADGYDPLKAAAVGLRANLRAALVDFGGLSPAEAEKRLDLLESTSDADLLRMTLKPMERRYAALVLRLKRLREQLRAADAIVAEGASADDATSVAAVSATAAAAPPQKKPNLNRPSTVSNTEQSTTAAETGSWAVAKQPAAPPVGKRQPAKPKASPPPQSVSASQAPPTAAMSPGVVASSPFAAFDGLAASAAGRCTTTTSSAANSASGAVVTDARAPASGDSATGIAASAASSRPSSLQGQHVGTLRGHARRVTAVLPLTGHRLVSASTDNSVRVWDLQTMACLQTLGPHASGPTALALLPGNVLAASGFDPSVSLWSLDDGKRIATLPGHQCHVHTLAAFADGFLLSACSETIRVWDTTNKRTVMLVPAQTTATVLLPDGSVLAGGPDGAITQWNLGTSSVSRSFQSHAGVNAKVIAFALLPNGKVVSGARQSELLLHDLATGNSVQLDTFGASKGAAFQSAAGISSLAVLADGSLAVARNKRHVCVRDPSTGELVHAEGFLKHDTRCESYVAATADGLLLTAGFEVPPSASASKHLPDSGKGVINVWR